MTKQELELVQIIVEVADERGWSTVPLQLYVDHLGIKRKDIKPLISQMIHKGYLQSKTRFDTNGQKRWGLKVRRRGYEAYSQGETDS